MALFSSLVNRIFGRNTSAQVIPAPNPASPTPLGQKLAPPQQVAATTAAGFVSVNSSNVAGIRWRTGRAIMGLLTPQDQKAAQPGPKGGAPVLGGVKGNVSGQSQQVPVGFMAPAEETDATLGVLTVRFKSGATYDYFDVPKKTYQEMYAAASKGRFVHRVLKQFRYRRVT